MPLNSRKKKTFLYHRNGIDIFRIGFGKSETTEEKDPEDEVNEYLMRAIDARSIPVKIRTLQTSSSYISEEVHRGEILERKRSDADDLLCLQSLDVLMPFTSPSYHNFNVRVRVCFYMFFLQKKCKIHKKKIFFPLQTSVHHLYNHFRGNLHFFTQLHFTQKQT